MKEEGLHRRYDWNHYELFLPNEMKHIIRARTGNAVYSPVW